jgi:hypothetical protein
MRHQDLRRFLEVRGDRDQRQLAFGAEEIADLVAAHEEFDPAEQQHQRPVGLRATGNDGDVEPVFFIRSVRRGLIDAAGLRVGEPVGGELHLVQRGSRRGEAGDSGQSRKCCKAHATHPKKRPRRSEARNLTGNRNLSALTMCHDDLRVGNRTLTPSSSPKAERSFPSPSGRRWREAPDEGRAPHRLAAKNVRNISAASLSRMPP